MKAFSKKAKAMKAFHKVVALVCIIIITEVFLGGVLYANVVLHTLCGGLLSIERKAGNSR